MGNVNRGQFGWSPRLTNSVLELTRDHVYMTNPSLGRAASSVNHSPVGADAESLVVSHLRQSDLFREYQQAFETTTGLPLVLREPGSFRTPLEGSKRMNPFCALMTKTNTTCAECLQLQQRLEEGAALGPKTLQCYAGLSETVVPVRVGDTVLGYLQTGQVFLQAPSRKRPQELSRMIHGGAPGPNPQDLKSAYFKTRVVTEKQYAAIIRLLAIFAEHLAAISNQLLIREAAGESPTMAKARTFIAEHQGEELHLGEVARAVHMSSFYFCKRFREVTGLTFTDYLARARTESAKNMLLNVHTRISEACYAAGFQSLSQFNRVFHRITGEAPSAYRDRLYRLHGKSNRQAALVHAA